MQMLILIQMLTLMLLPWLLPLLPFLPMLAASSSAREKVNDTFEADIRHLDCFAMYAVSARDAAKAAAKFIQESSPRRCS
eukprot:734297-Pleurochrysis_carterae.AAC.23